MSFYFSSSRSQRCPEKRTNQMYIFQLCNGFGRHTVKYPSSDLNFSSFSAIHIYDLLYVHLHVIFHCDQIYKSLYIGECVHKRKVVSEIFTVYATRKYCTTILSHAFPLHNTGTRRTAHKRVDHFYGYMRKLVISGQILPSANGICNCPVQFGNCLARDCITFCFCCISEIRENNVVRQLCLNIFS